MAVKTDIDNINANEEAEVRYYDSNPDFNTEETVQSNAADMYSPVDTSILERKRKVKTDVLSLIATGIINGAPILIDSLKHKKENLPYKTDSRSLIRFGVSMALPAIQAIDTIAFNGKLQNTLEERSPVKLSDIRNVVNIVQAYPATHRALKNFMSNVQAEHTGAQQIEIADHLKRDTILGCINTVSPYVIDKFCDNNMTFAEKCSSIIPIKIFGGMIRKIASTNPKLQQAYDVTTSIVRVADIGNKTLSTAIRPNSGVRTGASNTLGSILDLTQDMMGMTRGNISRFGDTYDGWSGGSRFNNF